MTTGAHPGARDAFLGRLFGLDGRVAVVTGATGTLGGAMARGLGQAGARVGVLGRRRERAEAVVEEIRRDGGQAASIPADVLRKEQLEAARDAVVDRWGGVDILVNAAGGNVPAATLSDDAAIFDLPEEALRQVFDLNLLGTVLPSQVFGAVMAERLDGTDAPGCVVNISSMAAQRALTRVMGYSAAKAAVENFTRWLAVELARRHGDCLRVNAISPGFFLGEQNRALLVGEDGRPTSRGQAILTHTPAARFGRPEDLLATLIWLCGPGAGFVTGVVVPVDGGFSAFGGV
jgi:NAD(P)-dependent dehydrogenase (short-subunit alcohol dehydrogenase family)